MSTKKNGVSPVEVETNPETNSYTEVAQARLQELRLMRDAIPHFRTPALPNETQRLSVVAAVPPEFIELTAVAVANERALVRVDGATPADVRDCMNYGDAFSPLADELEALAQFIRFSVAAARSKAARQALTTYALAPTSGQAAGDGLSGPVRRRHAPCAGTRTEAVARGAGPQGGEEGGKGSGESSQSRGEGDGADLVTSGLLQ